MGVGVGAGAAEALGSGPGVAPGFWQAAREKVISRAREKAAPRFRQFIKLASSLYHLYFRRKEEKTASQGTMLLRQTLS